MVGDGWRWLEMFDKVSRNMRIYIYIYVYIYIFEKYTVLSGNILPKIQMKGS